MPIILACIYVANYKPVNITEDKGILLANKEMETL